VPRRAMRRESIVKITIFMVPVRTLFVHICFYGSEKLCYKGVFTKRISPLKSSHDLIIGNGKKFHRELLSEISFFFMVSGVVSESVAKYPIPLGNSLVIVKFLMAWGD
jgi:hypothetical protein